MDKKEEILAEALDQMSTIFAEAAKKLKAVSELDVKPKAKEKKAVAPVKKEEPVTEDPVKTEEPKKEAAEPKPREYTLPEVRAKLTEVKQKGFGPQIKAIINAHGATNLTKLDPSEYAAVVAETEALHA